MKVEKSGFGISIEENHSHGGWKIPDKTCKIKAFTKTITHSMVRTQESGETHQKYPLCRGSDIVWFKNSSGYFDCKLCENEIRGGKEAPMVFAIVGNETAGRPA